MNILRNTVLAGCIGLGKCISNTPHRKILGYFVSSVVTVSVLRRIVQMDKYAKQLQTVVKAASKSSDELKDFELPDLQRLGKEISEEALKQIDYAITELKKKIGELKKKSKHATNQKEKEVLDYIIQKMEDALKALKELRKDVKKELKKSKK